MGTIHFERGQGQQGRAWDCSLVLVKYLESRPEVRHEAGAKEGATTVYDTVDSWLPRGASFLC